MMLRVIATNVPVRGALLAPGVALLIMPDSARQSGVPSVTYRGQPMAAPYGTVTLRPERDPLHIAAMRLPSDMQDDLPLLIGNGSAGHTVLYGTELDPDPLSITQGFSAADQWRLLDFLLNFCCAAFRLGRSAAFSQTCARLAFECARNAGSATVEATVGTRHVMVSGLAVAAGTTLSVIGRRGVAHSTVPVLPNGPLQIVPRLQGGDVIIAGGAEPVLWTVQEPPVVPPLLALPENGRIPAAAARAAVRQAFRSGGASGAILHLLKEMDALHPVAAHRLDAASQPIGGALELAVSDHGGGMFLAGWMRDPLGLVESLELETDTAILPLPPGSVARVCRPDIAKRFAGAPHDAGDARHGFIVHVPDTAGSRTMQPTLSLRLGSGTRIELRPPPRSLPAASARDLVLGYVPPGQMTPRIMRDCIAPAAARLHKAAMAERDGEDVIQIGKRIAKPSASILIPLYRNLGFMRFQAAAFADDPDCRRSEIIYVLDSPEQRNDVEHLLRGLNRLTDLPFTLVVMPRNLGYAAANNIGGRHARGPILLLLNSDVLPIEPGWMQHLLDPFNRATVAATGPKLLFEDGSIQHAGLYFDRDEDGLWYNRHYHKGMPQNWADARRRREVPGVTGAALAIRRSLFQKLGGVCEDYIIGDYEDSDLCLRLRQDGHTIFYVPEAELFHFERRSISLHAGYVRTHASLYNRLLHQDRWEQAMAELSVPAGPRRGRAA